MHVFDGKAHFSKAQLAARKNAEVKLGTQNFKMPVALKPIPEAVKKWKWLLKTYSEAGFTLVTTADKAILERYCLMWADYRQIRAAIAHIKQLFEWDHTHELYLAAYDRLGVDAKLHRISTELTKMEDKLFLTPIAKARTVSPMEDKPPAEDTPLAKKGFGNV